MKNNTLFILALILGSAFLYLRDHNQQIMVPEQPLSRPTPSVVTPNDISPYQPDRNTRATKKRVAKPRKKEKITVANSVIRDLVAKEIKTLCYRTNSATTGIKLPFYLSDVFPSLFVDDKSTKELLELRDHKAWLVQTILTHRIGVDMEQIEVENSGQNVWITVPTPHTHTNVIRDIKIIRLSSFSSNAEQAPDVNTQMLKLLVRFTKQNPTEGLRKHLQSSSSELASDGLPGDGRMLRKGTDTEKYRKNVTDALETIRKVLSDEGRTYHLALRHVPQTVRLVVEK